MSRPRYHPWSLRTVGVFLWLCLASIFVMLSEGHGVEAKRSRMGTYLVVAAFAILLVCGLGLYALSRFGSGVQPEVMTYTLIGAGAALPFLPWGLIRIATDLNNRVD